MKARIMLTSRTTKRYSHRWWVLFLFSSYSSTSSFQWINYSTIGHIVAKFYGVSSTAADWLSLIYMLVYIVLIIPVTWILDRYGLRVIAVTGSTLNALGALVKTMSNRPDLYSVCMVGSTISAIGQVFILGMAPTVAATWFGSKEVCTACSIGVFGYVIGIALGFLIPSILVTTTDVDDYHEIENSLVILTVATAIPATILAILVWFSFDSKPPIPPSQAQADLPRNWSYVYSLKMLVTDQSSLLLIISFGINIGAFYAISHLLNDQILEYFPGSRTNAGTLELILCGIMGCVSFGFILDKTAGYRTTAVSVYFLGLFSFLVYAASVEVAKSWLIYLVIGGVGFAMMGYLPVGFEYATEITYPINEGISAGLLTCSSQVFGMFLILTMRHLMDNYSILAANLTLCFIIAIGCCLTIFIEEDLKRQRANDNVAASESTSENEYRRVSEYTSGEKRDPRTVGVTAV